MLDEADVLALAGVSARQPARSADSAGRLQRAPVDSRRLQHGDYSGHIKP